MIISFINQKGGVGKTTLAFNFAYFLSRKGKTIFIDTDPQQSVFSFLEDREDPIPFDIHAITVLSKRSYQTYDYVVVDTAGFDSDNNRNIMQISDKVIVPTNAGILDIRSTYHILDIFAENSKAGVNTENYLLFNMVAGKDSLMKEKIKQVKQDVKEFPVKVLDHFLKHSVDFDKSMIQYKAIFEAENTKRGPAAKQLRQIILEVFKDGDKIQEVTG